MRENQMCGAGWLAPFRGLLRSPPAGSLPGVQGSWRQWQESSHFENNEVQNVLISPTPLHWNGKEIPKNLITTTLTLLFPFAPKLPFKYSSVLSSRRPVRERLFQDSWGRDKILKQHPSPLSLRELNVAHLSSGCLCCALSSCSMNSKGRQCSEYCNLMIIILQGAFVMVVLASRHLYPIEVPELFTATLIPITAAAESSSLETHLSCYTVRCYSCLLLLSPFMRLYTHTYLKVVASIKKAVGHKRKCTCRSKQHFAAIWICTSADGEPTIILASLRFPVIKAFCLCIYRVSL